MICSMTAFAREQVRGDHGELIWEIRSVNHRYLEVFVRLPEELRAMEPLVRETIAKKVQRGKLDCNLRYKPSAGAAPKFNLNLGLVNRLVEAGGEIGGILNRDFQPGPMEILRWPGVLEEQERDLSPVEAQAAELLEKNLDTLVKARQREGARLVQIVEQRCQAMREQVEKVRELMPRVLAGVRTRIEERLREVLGELDGTRLEQEMALIAQRLDVDEEMDRLVTHLDEVERVLDRKKAPVGRRLDFLMQELNREANTLASKSSDADVTRISVELKVLIEQMREQIQNLE